MHRDRLKIPKRLKQVTMWVHPEGRVVGSLFVRPQSVSTPGEEEPLEVLNTGDPFLVLKREELEELRFYNKSSVVRVEYDEDKPLPLPNIEPMPCTIHLMDGSIIAGAIRRALPPDRSRLFDYLNLQEELFVKIYCNDGSICVLNKSYIACVTP